MLEKLLASFLGAPAEQIAEYFKEKQRLKQELKLTKIKAQVAAERAREERAKQADDNDAAWESLQIQNSGWKDEYVLIVVSIPLVLSFIPSLAGYVVAGFAALNNTPTWYQILVASVFFAVYGIRYWRRKN